MTTEKPLKQRQRRFVEAYSANGGDGPRAAAAAGYKGAAEVLALRAREQLEREDVKAALAELADADAGDFDQDERPAIADKKERQRFWTLVMRAETEDGKALHVGMRDRLEASRLLSRVQGDFLEPDEDPNAKDGEIDRPRWTTHQADDVDLGGRGDADLNAELKKSLEVKDGVRRE